MASDLAIQILMFKHHHGIEKLILEKDVYQSW